MPFLAGTKRSIADHHIWHRRTADPLMQQSKGCRPMRTLLACPNGGTAAHNIWSYRVGTQYSDNDDDGETAAGKRLALLLTHSNATNVFVVVTRWYGGIHLGPDRFRHINNVARLLMVREGIIAGSCVEKKKKQEKKQEKKR